MSAHDDLDDIFSGSRDSASAVRADDDLLGGLGSSSAQHPTPDSSDPFDIFQSPGSRPVSAGAAKAQHDDLLGGFEGSLGKLAGLTLTISCHLCMPRVFHAATWPTKLAHFSHCCHQVWVNAAGVEDHGKGPQSSHTSASGKNAMDKGVDSLHDFWGPTIHNKVLPLGECLISGMLLPLSQAVCVQISAELPDKCVHFIQEGVQQGLSKAHEDEAAQESHTDGMFFNGPVNAGEPSFPSHPLLHIADTAGTSHAEV